MEYILIQGLGFVALLIGVIMFQTDKRGRMLTLQTVYNLIYGVQYLFLGSANSLYMCVIASARNIIFCNDKKFSKKIRIYMLLSFIGLLTITTMIHGNGKLGILSYLGAITSTLAAWQHKEKNIRKLSLISALIWLAHDVIIGSYAAVIDGVFLIGSILVGIYRFDIKKPKQDNLEQSVNG